MAGEPGDPQQGGTDASPGRVFSVAEANATLADLRERLPRIRDARHRLLESAEQIESNAPANGGGSEGAAYWDSLRSLREDVQYLADENIVLRDPETGLIDFPAEHGGEPAFWCWRLGEGDIAFWHDTQTGFSGRKPLEAG
jgi:hypothetical protein